MKVIQVDTYGNILYGNAKILPCRREKCVKEILTNSGTILKSTTRYFLDTTANVESTDLLDDCPILEMQEYTNSVGDVVGYECYV